MTRREILAFAARNPVAFLATADAEGNPHVRAMMTCRIDNQGLLFATGADKSIWKQIVANPHVEICYYSPRENMQIRIAGKVDIVEDQETKDAILQQFPFLRPQVEKRGYDVLAGFILRNGSAVVWTRDKPFEPKKEIEF